MVFVQNRKIAKRLESLEGKESEAICTISKKKWCIILAYRPPQNDKKVMFFNELNLSISQCVNKYDNIIVMRNLNFEIPYFV